MEQLRRIVSMWQGQFLNLLLGFFPKAGQFLFLALMLVTAEPASAAWLQGQKVASGSAAVLENLIGENSPLSAERAGENLVLNYDFASGSPVAARAVKAVNLPAWKKVGIDMGHVLERHTAQGALAAGRTTFPELMNAKGIERAIPRGVSIWREDR